MAQCHACEAKKRRMRTACVTDNNENERTKNELQQQQQQRIRLETNDERRVARETRRGGIAWAIRSEKTEIIIHEPHINKVNSIVKIDENKA